MKRKKLKSIILLFVIIFTLSSFNIVNATTYNFNKDTYELIFVKHDLISTNDNAYTLEYLGSTTYWVGTNASFIPITEDINGINSGFVFRGTNLTQYDDIWSAYLELTFYDDFNLEYGQFITIYGEDVNNASSYSTKADYEGRSLTSNNVVMWVEGSYSKDEVWRSTDLKYILQEIVDRAGYGKIDKNNIALRILAEGNSIDRSIYSFDSSVVKSAKLYISSTAYGHYPITVSMNNNQTGYWVWFTYNWDDFDPDYLGEGWKDQLYGWQQYTDSPNHYGDPLDYITGAVKGYSPRIIYAIASAWVGSHYTLRKTFNFINNTQDAFILSTRTWGPAGAIPSFRIDGNTIDGSDPYDLWRFYSNLVKDGTADQLIFGCKLSSSPNRQYYDTSIFYFHFPNLEGVNITKGSGDEDGEPSDVWIFEGSLGSPQYSDIDFNSTFKGFQTRGVIRWKDKMSELDFAIFSTNYTGSWVNSSYPLSGYDDFAYHDMILPDNETLYYQWYANNTVDNWNSTGILTLDLKDYSFKNAYLKNSDGSLNDGWIFRGDTYLFEANFSEVSTAIFNFTDGEHEIEFTYNNATQRLSINSDDQFVIGDYYYNITHYSDGITKATWGFIPNTNIVDINNATIDYTIYNEETGITLTGNTGVNFNIYNLGGFTYYSFNGDGRKTPYGTSAFDLYATNGTENSWARSEQIFRKLQHISFLIEIDMDNEWDDGNGEFDIDAGVGYVDVGFDYRLNGSWIEGYKIRLYVQSADVGHHNGGVDHDWVEWSVDFYNYDPVTEQQQNLQSQLIYSNHWGYEHENYVPDYYNRTSSQLWVDLWFDKTNASTTIASQVNAYYHGVKEQGSAWWFGYGTFLPMISNYDNAKFIDDLYDETGNVTNCQKYDLIKFYIKVGKVSDADGDDETWRIRAIEDMHREQGIDRMEGIDEPTFVQTKVLDMPQTGFINAIKSALGNIANSITQGIFFTMKSLWSGVGWILELMGLKEWYDALSMMLGNIATASMNLMDNLQDALINTVILIEQMFRMISTGFGRFTYAISNFISGMLDWYGYIVDMFSGGGIFNINIWLSLNLEDFFILGINLLPFWWLDRIYSSDDKLLTVKNDLNLVLWTITGLFNFLVTLIMLSVSLLDLLIGLLPI